MSKLRKVALAALAVLAISGSTTLAANEARDMLKLKGARNVNF